MVNKVIVEKNKFSMTTDVVSFQILLKKVHFVPISEIKNI